MLIRVLECLHKTDHLLNISANWQIVDAVVSQSSIWINDVGGTESNSSIAILWVLNQTSIVSGDGFVEVGDHWDPHWSKTTLGSWLEGVLSVSEVTVDGGSNHLGVNGFKLIGCVTEGSNLSWANEGEVKRPEEKHDIFSCTSQTKQKCQIALLK